MESFEEMNKKRDEFLRKLYEMCDSNEDNWVNTEKGEWVPLDELRKS